MRIACPVCNATYQVPDEQLSAGRIVRCARCATDWAPIEAIPESEGETDAGSDTPASVPVREPEPMRPSPQMALEDEAPPHGVGVAAPAPPAWRAALDRAQWLPIAWVMSLAVIVATLGVLVFRGEQVMQAWPPSIRAYAALGLAGHSKGAQ